MVNPSGNNTSLVASPFLSPRRHAVTTFALSLFSTLRHVVYEAPAQFISQWIYDCATSFLGIPTLQRRLGELEQKLARFENIELGVQKKIHAELSLYNKDHLFPLTQNLFTALEHVTKSVGTLDQRVSAYRKSDILGRISDASPKARIVLFKGRKYFGDNIKYAFLACNARSNQDDMRCYFLPDTQLQYDQLTAEGLPCLPCDLTDYTVQELSIILRAEIVVLDEQFTPPNWRHTDLHALLRNKITIQLWHGIPLKKIGLETFTNPLMSDLNVTDIFASCGPFDVFVAPGLRARSDWEKRFSFRSFAPLGYPRNDIFFRELSSLDKMNIDTTAFSCIEAAYSQGKPVIFYALTFRDVYDAEGGDWFRKAEIAAFAAYCEANDYLLYVNLHPGEQSYIKNFRQDYPLVRFIVPHTDIYPILKSVSILVTDYSSLALDFLLLDRPIVFYRPDHEDYQKNSRHLIEDHEHYVCGETAFDIHSLTSALSRAVMFSTLAAQDPYCEKRHALQQELFDHQDGMSSQRLCDEILKLMNTQTKEKILERNQLP